MTIDEVNKKFKLDILEAGADMRAKGLDIVEVSPERVVPKLWRQCLRVAPELAKLGISVEMKNNVAVLTAGNYVPPAPEPEPEPEPEEQTIVDRFSSWETDQQSSDGEDLT